MAPESQLKHLLPGRAGFDAGLLDWASKYVERGDTVWDIGANCGVFAMAAAGRGANVLAVEPDPFLTNGLVRARAANPALSITVVAAAVSDSEGLATLQIAAGGRAANSLAGFAGTYTPFGEVAGEVTVPTVTLDSLLATGTPKLVKIDVEGAEAAVLKGARRLLSKVRPVLIVEVGLETADEVGDLFRANAYRMFDADTGKPTEWPTCNTLALP